MYQVSGSITLRVVNVNTLRRHDMPSVREYTVCIVSTAVTAEAVALYSSDLVSIYKVAQNPKSEDTIINVIAHETPKSLIEK